MTLVNLENYILEVISYTDLNGCYSDEINLSPSQVTDE